VHEIRDLRLWAQLPPTNRAQRVYLLNCLDQTAATEQVSTWRADEVVVSPVRTVEKLTEGDLARRKLLKNIWIVSEHEGRVVLVRGTKGKPAVREASSEGSQQWGQHVSSAELSTMSTCSRVSAKTIASKRGRRRWIGPDGPKNVIV
jgi:hypothetical protein